MEESAGSMPRRAAGGRARGILPLHEWAGTEARGILPLNEWAGTEARGGTWFCHVGSRWLPSPVQVNADLTAATGSITPRRDAALESEATARAGVGGRHRISQRRPLAAIVRC